jgi:hypothetical protein
MRRGLNKFKKIKNFRYRVFFLIVLSLIVTFWQRHLCQLGHYTNVQLVTVLLDHVFGFWCSWFTKYSCPNMLLTALLVAVAFCLYGHSVLFVYYYQIVRCICPLLPVLIQYRFSMSHVANELLAWMHLLSGCTDIYHMCQYHITVLRLVCGHSAHCGLRSQLVRIWSGVVHSMVAIFLAVHSHICFPSPHSVSRCCSLSFLPHLLHVSVGDIFIFCRRTFVWRMSWITLYYMAFILSGTGTSCTFAQTVLHSIPGHILVIRSSFTSVSLLIIRCSVQYVLLLYVLFDSVGRCCSV